MIIAKFNGWFECRLATDPDPADEPRGVSGYMRALPNEPDFDRVIRFHDPVSHRTHCPVAGVFVTEVHVDGSIDSTHWLNGAKAELIDSPVFKGDNGVVAEDGNEPIVPFNFQLTKNGTRLSRTPPPAPEYSEFPYRGLQAVGIVFSPGEMSTVTGISDISEHLRSRRQKLEELLSSTTDETERFILQSRIDFLTSRVASRFFGAKMPYFVPLAGPTSVHDPDGNVGKTISVDSPWMLDVWFGAWDPDCCMGYAQGHIVFPAPSGDDPIA